MSCTFMELQTLHGSLCAVLKYKAMVSVISQGGGLQHPSSFNALITASMSSNVTQISRQAERSL